MNIFMAFTVLLSSVYLLICRVHRSQSIVLSNCGRGVDQRQWLLALALALTFGRSKFPLDFLSLRECRSGYFYLISLSGYMQRFNLVPYVRQGLVIFTLSYSLSLFN